MVGRFSKICRKFPTRLMTKLMTLLTDNRPFPTILACFWAIWHDFRKVRFSEALKIRIFSYILRGFPDFLNQPPWSLCLGWSSRKARSNGTKTTAVGAFCEKLWGFEASLPEGQKRSAEVFRSFVPISKAYPHDLGV